MYNNPFVLASAQYILLYATIVNNVQCAGQCGIHRELRTLQQYNSKCTVALEAIRYCHGWMNH